MENQEKITLKRVLKEQHFETAKRAVEGGKKSGTLENPELNEELIEKFKGKTIQSPIEVILTSVLFLEACEIIRVIEILKKIFKDKMMEELKTKADKGELTKKDIMTTLLLAAIDKKNTKQKDK